MTETLSIRTQPLLGRLALLHLAVAALEAPLLLLDPRRVNGEPVWLKPIRFDISIAIFAASMIWVLAPLAAEVRASFAKRIAAAMLIETICIALQASRGVASHFNNASLVNSAIFALMGVAIVYNTYLVGKIAFVLRKTTFDPVVKRATILALLSVISGSLVGSLMSAMLTHTGRHGGDLRLAHAIGLHGLQLLLIAGALLRNTRWPQARQITALNVTFALHLALTAAATAGA